MKVLVTGGAGFIGSHLAERLLKQGDEVTVVDDLSTGSRENIEGVISNTDFSFVEGSVLDVELVRRTMTGCELIYHLAAAVGVKYVIDNPLQAIHVNVQGTENVLATANDLGGLKVVLASTSEIYGKTKNGHFREDADCIMGSTDISRWSYCCSKALDEFLAFAYWRKKKLPVVIVRFFNVCGPRQSGRYGMVIPRFVEQALRGEAITIYGDGKQTRSFTYIDDILEGLLRLAVHAGAVGQVFNLGSEEAVAIEELARRVKKLSGSNSPLTYVPYEVAYPDGFEDMLHRVPDISKVRNLVGYEPVHELNGILQEVIGYFRRRLEAE